MGDTSNVLKLEGCSLDRRTCTCSSIDYYKFSDMVNNISLFKWACCNYSWGLSTATTEYSCLSMCVSVCLSICLPIKIQDPSRKISVDLGELKHWGSDHESLRANRSAFYPRDHSLCVYYISHDLTMHISCMSGSKLW